MRLFEAKCRRVERKVGLNAIRIASSLKKQRSVAKRLSRQVPDRPRVSEVGGAKGAPVSRGGGSSSPEQVSYNIKSGFTISLLLSQCRKVWAVAFAFSFTVNTRSYPVRKCCY